MPKIAVVTGGNKGIGFAIVKGLCQKFDGKVYLTARDVKRGQEAVEKLKALGLNPDFHQLDITDDRSVNSFKCFLELRHGGIDLLVNNAAIAFKEDSTVPFGEQAEETMKVNFSSLLRVCDAFFPLLKRDARVVNLSSSAGRLTRIPSAKLRVKLNSPNLTIPELKELMQQFVEDAKAGLHKENGWGISAYAVSKVGVSAFTIIQQRIFNQEEPYRNISINSVHPGYVATDMTSNRGSLTIEQGAEAPLYLALGSHQFKGKYMWYDKKLLNWDGSGPPGDYS